MTAVWTGTGSSPDQKDKGNSTDQGVTIQAIQAGGLRWLPKAWAGGVSTRSEEMYTSY